MGIHDLGFRSYDGARTSLASRTLALSWAEIRRFFKSKKFLYFFLFCITPAIIAFVFVYIRFVVIEGQGELAGFEQMRERRGAGRGPFGGNLETLGFYFRPFFRDGMLLTILFSAVVGAGSISLDREKNALEIYLTRGIRPIHYFAGKWIATCFLMLCQLCFPLFVVWLSGVLLSSGWDYYETTVAFMPRLVLAQVFVAGIVSFLVVAQSSSTDSTRFAVIRWLGSLFVLLVVGLILSRVSGDRAWLALSPWHAIVRVAGEIAGYEGRPRFDVFWGALACSLLTIAGLYWARRHMRAVEVVG